MKTLIAYYSRSGYNEIVARLLHSYLQCDIAEIVDLEDRSDSASLFKSVMSPEFRTETKLKPMKKKVESYEHVILCSPVWVGVMPPATTTFARLITGKVSVISVSGEGKDKIVKQIEKLLDTDVEYHLELREKDVVIGSHVDKVNEFAEKIKHIC